MSAQTGVIVTGWREEPADRVSFAADSLNQHVKSPESDPRLQNSQGAVRLYMETLGALAAGWRTSTPDSLYVADFQLFARDDADLCLDDTQQFLPLPDSCDCDRRCDATRPN